MLKAEIRQIKTGNQAPQKHYCYSEKMHFNIWGYNHVNKPGVQPPAAALVSMPISCSKSAGLSNIR